MATISGGKVTGSGGDTFAALKARLAQGKGKMSKLSSGARGNKTSWSKGSAKSMQISKGNPTLAVSGATPGVKKTGI